LKDATKLTFRGDVVIYRVDDGSERTKQLPTPKPIPVGLSSTKVKQIVYWDKSVCPN